MFLDKSGFIKPLFKIENFIGMKLLQGFQNENLRLQIRDFSSFCSSEDHINWNC